MHSKLTKQFLSLLLIGSAVLFSVTASAAMVSESSFVGESKDDSCDVTEEPKLSTQLTTVNYKGFDSIEVPVTRSLSVTLREEKEEPAEENVENEADSEILDDVDPLMNDIEITFNEDWSIIPLSKELVETVFTESAINDIDPFVVIALMESESGFQTDAVSCVGCYGLMQLHPLYYPEDIVEPHKNIKYGCETIGNNMSRTNDYILALSMYANGHIGTNFTYQYDVMERSEKWRQRFIEANII